MQRTMQAAVVRDFGAPLVVEETPVPEPGEGQILVKVEACGVCHTDARRERRLAGEARAALHPRPRRKETEARPGEW